MNALVFLLLVILFEVQALFNQHRFPLRKCPVSIRSSLEVSTPKPLFARKKDLFSDDLFDEPSDDDAQSNVPEKKNNNDSLKSSKKKYLEEKWELNSEDAKDFKGFPKQQSLEKASGDDDVDLAAIKSVPCFALMYKFRKEYVDIGTESVMADHKGYCMKFNKILGTEVLSLGKSKGVVVLWAGFEESTADETETRADIMKFLEDDPLVVKDIVENWDIIDLTPKSQKQKWNTGDNVLPTEVIKS